MELGEPRRASSCFFPSKTEELHQIQASDVMAKNTIRSQYFLSSRNMPRTGPSLERTAGAITRQAQPHLHARASTWDLVGMNSKGRSGKEKVTGDIMCRVSVKTICPTLSDW